jgi:hypothetical protein
MVAYQSMPMAGDAGGRAQELAIHQEDIEKIELLGQVCRHLKILYLQDNLIHKLGPCPTRFPSPDFRRCGET